MSSPESAPDHAERDELGRFLPGASANPGGRPAVLRDVRALAQARGPEAIERLTEIMRTGKPDVALRAAEALLARGFGHPSIDVSMTAAVAMEDVAAWNRLGAEVAERLTSLAENMLRTERAALAAPTGAGEPPQ